MKEKERLFIPVNVRRRKLYVEGFGKKELIQSGISTGVGIFIGVILFFIFDYQWILIAFSALVFLGVSIIVLHKDRYNSNMIDMVIEMHEYRKSQKKYEYKYSNIHEREVERKEHGKEIIDT